MKVLMILLPALVQLAVFGAVDLTCNRLKISVLDLAGKVLFELEKTNALFGDAGLFYGVTPADSCVMHSINNYLQAYEKEINFDICGEHESSKDGSNDCMKTNLLQLDCCLTIAKNGATLVHKTLEEMTECSSLGSSKFVEEVKKQRSDLEFNQTVIDEMEELQRKYSGHSLSL